MNALPQQLTLADASPEYAEWLDKFKPKKTTDDCYTPEPLYNAVAAYVARRFNLDPASFVRPFWPGADYKRAEYPAGCTVVDNPPFSIISAIVEWYQAHGVRFFLFAPYLTNIGIARRSPGVTHTIAPVNALYANGATVPTSFVHNLAPEIAAEADAELYAIVNAADEETRHANKKELPKYEYPQEIVTSARLGYLAVHGQTFRVPAAACAKISALDSQVAQGKAIFGTGLILAQAQAQALAQAQAQALAQAQAQVQAQAQAQKWPLSERERAIIAELNKRNERT